MKTVVSLISDRIVITRTDKNHIGIEYFRGDQKVSSNIPGYVPVGGTLTLLDIILIPVRYVGPKEGEDFPGSCPADWE